MASLEELNALDADAFRAAMAPLFEGAPRFAARLAAARPFGSAEELFEAARMIARSMPEEEQRELLDSHPRIGSDSSAVSELSRREQSAAGPDEPAWVGEELRALNEAYEARFGFRFVVFVAGRPKAEVIPILERALHADRDEELRRGLDDVVLIAADRFGRLGDPRDVPEDLREAMALEVSRWMIGEQDRDGLVRAAHRLIEEGVESPALLALSLANHQVVDDVGMLADRLMSEIGLEGWDAGSAGQLLALHAAASIVGEVSQPIDGARRIAGVSGNGRFRDLVARWEADAAGREAIDAEIRHAASDLFGPSDAED